MKKIEQYIFLLIILMTILFLNIVHAQEKDISFKVGIASRSFTLNIPYNWRGAKTHALIVKIWYPADAASLEQPLWIPPDFPIFYGGKAARNASIAPSPHKFPMIVLSHGTGGSASQMAWLGTMLASHGYIAVAVNHPGNNALEEYTASGGVGHYVFLDKCTLLGRIFAFSLCNDGWGVERETIHAKTAELALKFFTVNLR